MPEDKLLYRELTGAIIGAAIVDAKAIAKLTSLEEALLLNYLKVTKLRVGLTINFGELSLTHIRRVL